MLAKRVTAQTFAMTLDSLESEKIISPDKSSRTVVCDHCSRNHPTDKCWSLRKQKEKEAKTTSLLSDKETTPKAKSDTKKDGQIECNYCHSLGHTKYNCAVLEVLAKKNKTSGKGQQAVPSAQKPSYNGSKSFDKFGRVNRVRLLSHKTET